MAEIRTFRTYGIDTDDGNYARVGDMVWVVDLIKYDCSDDVMPCDFYGGLIERVEQWGAEVNGGRFNNKSINLEREPKDKVFRSREKAEAFLEEFWKELEKKQKTVLDHIQDQIARSKKQKKEMVERVQRQKTEEQLWQELEDAQKRLMKIVESP